MGLIDEISLPESPVKISGAVVWGGFPIRVEGERVRLSDMKVRSLQDIL